MFFSVALINMESTESIACAISLQQLERNVSPTTCPQRKRNIRTRSFNTSTSLSFTILLILLLLFPPLAASQDISDGNRIPQAPLTTLYPFPTLPPETQIFTTQTFCRATYTTCMEIFRDCLRVVGGISGANQVCEQWRNDTCENGIRVGCDGIPAVENRSSVQPSSIAFETTTAVVGSSTSTLSTVTTTTGTKSSTSTNSQPSPPSSSTQSRRPSSSSYASTFPSAPTTVTVTTTLLVPTTLISIYTTTITYSETITTTQTLTNSNGGVIGTTTMTTTIQVTTAVPRGLTFAINAASESRYASGWKWVLWTAGLTTFSLMALV